MRSFLPFALVTALFGCIPTPSDVCPDSYNNDEFSVGVTGVTIETVDGVTSFSWSGGSTVTNVTVLGEDLEEIWSVTNADGISSPVVYGVTPDGATEDLTAEALTDGIQYTAEGGEPAPENDIALEHCPVWYDEFSTN